MGSSLYWGQKKNRIPRDQKSGLEVRFHSIATGKLRRYFSFQNMMDVFKVAWGRSSPLQSCFVCAHSSLLKRRICFCATSDRSPTHAFLSISMSPIFLWDWPIKLLINLLPRCTTFEQAHGLTKSAYRCGNQGLDHIPPTSEVLEEKNKRFPKRLADPSLCRRISRCACL